MTGALEASSDVRSIPLGAKRKRGRPKKLPNCLAKSPVREAPPCVELPGAEETLHLGELGVIETPGVGGPAAGDDTSVDAPVRKTSRKRQQPEDPTNNDQLSDEVQQSPVIALLGQSRILKPGLGASKPPKKNKRLQGTPTAPIPAVQSSSGVQSSSSVQSSSAPSPSNSELPPAVKCKKRLNTCNHHVVFGVHYNNELWKKYADSVHLKKSCVQNDPNYIP